VNYADELTDGKLRRRYIDTTDVRPENGTSSSTDRNVTFH